MYVYYKIQIQIRDDSKAQMQSHIGSPIFPIQLFATTMQREQYQLHQSKPVPATNGKWS